MADLAVWGTLKMILGVIGIFTSVIFVHELGHFLVAKFFGVRVNVFSIGLPPKLLTLFKWRETEYQLGALPLGGYVKFDGPDFREDLKPDDPQNGQYFVTKPVWQKTLVILAGVSVNFLCAIAIAIGMTLYAGKIAIISTVVSEVMKNYPAEKAGLKKGDEILSINGVRTKDWAEVDLMIRERAQKHLTFEVLRGGRTIQLVIAPMFLKEENRYLVGIKPTVVVEEIGKLAALGYGVTETWRALGMQFRGMYNLIRGKISRKNVSGPVEIMKSASTAIEGGWPYILNWIYIISIALVLMNLLPIPGLDGGFLPMFLLEMIRGKPLNKETQIGIFNFGYVILLAIMVFAVFNDFSR